MTAESNSVRPSRELLSHHLRTNLARLVSENASRADVVRFIGSLGEDWR